MTAKRVRACATGWYSHMPQACVPRFISLSISVARRNTYGCVALLGKTFYGIYLPFGGTVIYFRVPLDHHFISSILLEVCGGNACRIFCCTSRDLQQKYSVLVIFRFGSEFWEYFGLMYE